MKARHYSNRVIFPDNYEKLVLSMDRQYINFYGGIKALNVIDWPLGIE